MQGPDTDAQDQPPPFIHIRLATHGRSIQLGQTEKNSACANVFRVTPESAHCSIQSACLKGAINGSRQPYSITSSARPSNVAGISMPSALAAPTSLVVPFFIHIAGPRTAQSDCRPRLRPLMGCPAPPLVPCPRLLGQLNL
jgi:hypothetical protein